MDIEGKGNTQDRYQTLPLHTLSNIYKSPRKRGGKMKNKATVFVEHIEKHLREIEKEDIDKTQGYTLKGKRHVMCKICDKTIDEIYEEYKKEGK